jgi:hypothetical protein
MSRAGGFSMNIGMPRSAQARIGSTRTDWGVSSNTSPGVSLSSISS